jgi:plasmid stabilization system protein ParE
VKLVWHPLAMADRECIMDFIARDKPMAALALDENFETHADRIEANPHLYRPGRVPGTREGGGASQLRHGVSHRGRDDHHPPRAACRATLAIVRIAITVLPASTFGA